MGETRNRPQVFINFRGKDERQKLLPHLKQHLRDSNVNVFTDEEATGERLKDLLKHIRESKIVIVIFSINYLESRWCLDELVEIKKCLETEKLDFVIPIFYKVKTSHVKKQSGKFGKNFKALQKKYPNSTIKRWKNALRFIAKSIGLTYGKKSSISELDFIKKIVERVNITLTKITSKEKNDTPKSSKVFSGTLQGEASNPVVFDENHVNKLIQISKTVEALNLERSYLQGFMYGTAWKDAIDSSMQSRNTFRIPPPANSLQFSIAQGNDSLEKAINWLALHMMSEQTNPALIFSNWDKLRQDTKNNIIYSARRKSQMLKGVDLKPIYPPFVQVPIWNRNLEPKVPQDWPHRRASIPYHNNQHYQYNNPLPHEMVLVQNPIVHPQRIDLTYDPCPLSYSEALTQNCEDVKKMETNCISFLCYCFKRCLSLLTCRNEEDDTD